MSRFPLLMILFSVLVLIGCSEQSGTSSGGGGTSTSTSSTGGTTTTSSSGGTTTSSSGGTTTSSSGGPDPDPIPVFPSSGISDQNSFSVAVSAYNPRGGQFDGTTVTLTARLADQLGNNTTIADGTEVFWATDGGSIQPNCTTTGGSCSIIWTSQNPRPAAGPAIPDPLGSADTVTSYASNRASVLVWTLGTESFTDNNSNGFFDTGDVQIDDLPEAFIDKNENGTRDANEEFVNYPLEVLGATVPGAVHDPANGLYSGTNCAHPSLCATDQTVFNFMNIELAMSSDNICIVDVAPAAGYWDATISYGATVLAGSATFYFLVHDCFGNPPMSGTTIEFSSDVGADTFSDGGTVENTNFDMGVAVTGSQAPTRERYPLNSLVYSATVLEDPGNTTPEAGTLDMTVTPPAGSVVVRFIPLTDP